MTATKPAPASGTIPRRILIVDDHPLTRRGMAALIAQHRDLSVCGEAGDAAQALAAVKALHPDLVLADLTLPDKHGLELIKDLKAFDPRLAILVVSMHDESFYAERVLRAGARGYLMKNEGGEKLLLAIRKVFTGGTYVSPALSARFADVLSGGRSRKAELTVASLTDRELEVFEYLGQGLSTREMGNRMRLSPKTVETYRINIRNKLRLSGSDLLKYAVRYAGAQELI
jgi:DNA-binding NarL/FixJ family response regulator